MDKSLLVILIALHLWNAVVGGKKNERNVDHKLRTQEKINCVTNNCLTFKAHYEWRSLTMYLRNK